MTNPTINLNINLNLGVYEAQFRREVAADLAALKILLDPNANQNTFNNHFFLSQGIVVSQITVPSKEYFIQREINKCFKSIVASLQDFMDKLIAILNFKTRKINFDFNLQTDQQLKQQLMDYVNQLIEEEIFLVSTDGKFTIPRKLNYLLEKPEYETLKVSIQSYFDLRNGLEHHKGIAKKDRVISYKRIKAVSMDGIEVEFSNSMEFHENVTVKTFDEFIAYDKGGSLIISVDQLESIVLNILIFVIPSLLKVVEEKIKE